MLTYGLSFILMPHQPLHEAPIDTIRSVVQQWLHAKLEKLDPQLGGQFTHTEVTYDDGAGRVWEFTLSEPFEDTSVWRTELRLLETLPPLKCSVCMRIISSSKRIAPLSFYVETPRFLRTLGEHFRVFIGDTEARAVPTLVDESDAEEFIQLLRDDRRSLPLVAISHPASGPPLLPQAADLLSRYLFPLANVIELTQPGTWYLTQTLGKEMSCFDAGIRIYWPGWSEDDSPIRHPLWWKGKIHVSLEYDVDDPYKLIRMSLMRRLVGAATGRFEYPEEISSVLQNYQKRLDAAILKQLGIAKTEELSQHVKELLEGLKYYREYSELLETENQELKNENERVHLETAILEEGIRSGRHEPSYWQVQSAEEAVTKAQTDFSDTLLFATDFDYVRLAGEYVYKILQCLDELCLVERHGTRRPPRELLAEIMARRLGDSKFLQIGDTQLRKTHPTTGERVHLRHRVHISSGAPTKTLSVYWEKVREGRTFKYLVGRIGRHA